jgi:hypothetical protein
VQEKVLANAELSSEKYSVEEWDASEEELLA